jgi:DNA-binding NtrC family response regulator
MIRPCFLVIDTEFPGSISTRKLVIETAKFNVVTAYSAQEALETLEAFPGVSGVVMNSDGSGMPGEQLISSLKQIKSGIPVVVIVGPGINPCPSADHELATFDPQKLLDLLRSLVPAMAKTIEKHERELSAGQS